MQKKGHGYFHCFNDRNAIIIGIGMAAEVKEYNKECIKTAAENGYFQIFTYWK